MKVVRLLAWRRLRGQPLRAVIAALTVGAGVSVAVAVVIVLGSLDTSVREAARSLSGPTPLRVIGATARGGIDEALTAKVQAVDGVEAAVPLVQGISLVTRADGAEEPAVVLGVDCSFETLVGPFGCTPDLLAAADGGPPFVPPALTTRIGPGAVLRTDLGRVSLDGAVPAPGLDGVNDGAAVAFPLGRAQRELARPGLVDVIYVQPAAGTDLDAVRDRVQAVVGSSYSVLERDDPPPVVGVVLVAFVPLFSIIAILTLAVGGVLVYNSVTLSVEERRRQQAIITALGAGPRVAVAGLLVEAGVLGLVGGLLGAAGGAVVAGAITGTLSDFTERIAGVPLHVHVEPAAVVIAVLLGAVVGVAAAWRPARRSTRLDVAAELGGRDLRDDAAAAVSPRRIAALLAVTVIGVDLAVVARHDGGLEPWQALLAPLAFLVTVAALALLVGALTPRVLGRADRFARRRSAPVRLAFGNLLREPRRTGVMAVALGLAVGTGFATASFGQSVRQAVRDNLTKNLHGVNVSTVDPNNSVNIDSRLSPATLAGLAALPGVARVEKGSALVVGRTTGTLLTIAGYDDTWLDTVDTIEGRIDPARYAAGEVLIGPGLARRTGLRAGGTLALETPHGNVEVKVLAVVQNGDSGGNNVTMPYELMERIYGPQPPDGVNLDPAPGVTPEQLASTVRAANLDPSLQIRTAPDLASKIGDSVSQQLAPFYALQRALLVMAFIAVLSTLLLVGVQRRRELAMLAAIGMQPSEIARMIVAEGAIVAAAGAVVGLASSVVFYGVLLMVTPVLIGYDDPFVVDPVAAIVYAVLAVVVAVMATIYPALRSARAEVLPALQYE